MKKRQASNHNYYLRDFESVQYTETLLPDEFKVFIEKEVWPLITTLHSGYKVDEKKVLAAHIVHNLIEAGLTGKTVADSRDYNDWHVRRRLPIWNALVKHKFCKLCKGSQYAKRVTRYFAKNVLLKLREKWDLSLLENLDLKRNTEVIEPTRHALVVLYSGNTDWLTGRTLPDEQQHKPISLKKRIEATAQRDENDIRKPDPEAVKNGLDYFKNIENKLNRINDENLSHSWVTYTLNDETGNKIAFQPNVCLRQVHSGKLFRGARLYSWGALSGQSMSKEQSINAGAKVRRGKAGGKVRHF